MPTLSCGFNPSSRRAQSAIAFSSRRERPGQTGTAMNVLQHEHAAPPHVDRALGTLATALAVWSVAYMVPHVYWALDGTMGLSAAEAVGSGAARMARRQLGGDGRVGTAGADRLGADAGSLRSLQGRLVDRQPGGGGDRRRARRVRHRLPVTHRRRRDRSRRAVFRCVTSRLGRVGLRRVRAVVLDRGLLFAGVGWAASPPAWRRSWIVACVVGVGLATLSGLVGVRV